MLRRPLGRMRAVVNREEVCSTTQPGRGGVWRHLNRWGSWRAFKGCRRGPPPQAYLPPASGASSGPDQGALLALWNSLSPEQREALEKTNPSRS